MAVISKGIKLSYKVSEGQFTALTNLQEIPELGGEKESIEVTTLADAAHNAGVIQPKDYAIFQNAGYKGLYGGMTRQDIHAHKHLKKSQNILDYMGHEELAANLFRATQTEAKLRRENIKGKEAANKTHFDVGAAVRQTIKDLGGTMPEDLPTPKESIRQLEQKFTPKKYRKE